MTDINKLFPNVKTKNGKRLSAAFSQLIMAYLAESNEEMASRVTTVAHTLRAEPELMDKLAKILAQVP